MEIVLYFTLSQMLGPLTVIVLLNFAFEWHLGHYLTYLKSYILYHISCIDYGIEWHFGHIYWWNIFIWYKFIFVGIRDSDQRFAAKKTEK